MAKSKKSEKVEGKRSVEEVLDLFNKSNTGAEMQLMDGDFDRDIPVVSYGSLMVDIASGVGGAPQGRLIELFGQESVGKSTLALMLVAVCQRAGHIAAYLDLENALDVKYMKKLGVQTENLLMSQPDSGEQALDAVESLTGILTAGDVIVIDSVAALTPRSEIEGAMGDSHMGLQARLMSQACRKLTGIANKRGVTIVFINQLRQKIGIVYGDPSVTTGGNSLKFYASQRIDMRKIGSNKDREGNIISNKVRIKFVKNKVAPPFREAETQIRFGYGIPRDWEILQLSVKLGLIEKAGTWFKYQGESIGQGEETAAAYLLANPKIMNELEKAIRKEYKV